MTEKPTIETRRERDVLVITLSRPEKRNAFNLRMLRELAEAFTEYERDGALRCAALVAAGEHFTAGLDLAEVGPAFARGEPLFPHGLVDPMDLAEPRRVKPVVCAVRGWCLTIGVELLLASDIRLAAEGTRLAQMEVRRGIMPFGGATIRLPRIAGWGNAMRWLLTGEEFDAREALRIGIVQEVAQADKLEGRALEIARSVARAAPLAVRASRESAREAMEEGHGAAVRRILERARALTATDDAMEGVMSFVERREARFKGK